MTMIAYSRGSQILARAASLKNRMPAIDGAFGIHSEIAQLAEQQTCDLWAAGSIPVIQSAVRTAQPGLQA
jgi:hypothetical protein